MATSPNLQIVWSTHVNPVLLANPRVQSIENQYEADYIPPFTTDPAYPDGPLPASYEVNCPHTGILLPRISNAFLSANTTAFANQPQLLWYNVDTGLCQMGGAPGVGIVNINATPHPYTSGSSRPLSFTNTGTVTTPYQLYTDLTSDSTVPAPLQSTILNPIALPLVEVRSSNSGILIPRLPDSYIQAVYNYIVIPEAAGLWWYNVTLNSFQHCTGSFIYTWNSTPLI